MAGRPHQPESSLSTQAASQGLSPGATAKAAALSSANTSPVMRQYLEIKSGHEDAILFFRLGDFYEMFFEDAETASKILDIALTSRNKSDEHPIPMCGIPYHSARNYVARLLEAGVKVAICEQIELPRRGIARRQVARVVTPGTSLDEETLAPECGNYIACLVRTAAGWAMSRADFSTGELRVTELVGRAALEDELEGLAPSELLVEEGADASELESLRALLPRCLFTERAVRAGAEVSPTTAALLEGGALPVACRDAIRVLLIYLDETQGGRTAHLREPELYEASGFLKIDRATRRNLEIVESVEGGRRGSLLGAVDGSVTPMGKRLVREWLLKPLADVGAIGERLDAVELFVEDASLATDLREALRGVGDVERLGGRLGSGAAGARDLLRLADALDAVENTRALFAEKSASGLIGRSVRGLDTLDEVRGLVRRAIAEEPPLSVGKGATIRDGYHEEVDRLRAISTDGKGWMTGFEAAERQRTGIPKLKVGYNKVFGYYIEASRAAQDRVPEEYERKQTLANAERYITPELKRREADLLGAEERLSSLESHLLAEVTAEVAAHVSTLARTASSLALLDGLAGLADTAYRGGYVRPDICKDGPLQIVEGRHPVVESALGSRFVPNDCVLGGDGDRVMVITGPNMAGKSTYLRQVALVALLAHCGSFVPATSARVPLVDRIFTRIGASDNLARGQSTFMVEMTETATILSMMTDRSLVVLDEIGRGTSTFDGISIAWAVAEAMVRAGVKTLFATHYHELAGLASEHDCVGNYSVAVRRYEGDIVFLYRVVEGATSGSYGIEVARLAGVPEPVIEAARRMLARFERSPGPTASEREQQPSLFGPVATSSGSGTPEEVAAGPNESARDVDRYQEVLDRLSAVEIDTLTPLKALNLLAELSRAARDSRSC
jgi:DNA mismatch repair protein MutS